MCGKFFFRINVKVFISCNFFSFFFNEKMKGGWRKRATFALWKKSVEAIYNMLLYDVSTSWIKHGVAEKKKHSRIYKQVF
jgi:hypothetical protein